MNSRSSTRRLKLHKEEGVSRPFRFGALIALFDIDTLIEALLDIDRVQIKDQDYQPRVIHR